MRITKPVARNETNPEVAQIENDTIGRVAARSVAMNARPTAEDIIARVTSRPARHSVPHYVADDASDKIQRASDERNDEELLPEGYPGVTYAVRTVYYVV